MKIGLIDPALYTADGVTSPNIGDQVISRAVHRELRAIFGESSDIVAIPSHQYPTRRTVEELRGAEHVFVGGSNLLYFRWWRPTSWKIGLVGLSHFRDLILMGTGWGAYNIKSNSYGKWLCKVILSQEYEHSVRDGFTRNLVAEELCVPKVANTACPTMWCLTDSLVKSIPGSKGDECIFSLTDYSKEPALDGQLVRDLSEAYGGKLLFWPQGKGDLEYCRSLGYTGRVIDRSLVSLLDVLTSGSQFDYVGTRLHAGVLCLEHRVRSLIISIDNRAQEIAADTGLPTVSRTDRDSLLRWTAGDSQMDLKLPSGEIARWRQQFRSSMALAA